MKSIYAGSILQAFILAVVLAGCSVGEAFRRPDAPKPAAWANEVAATPAWPGREWWRQFGSPRLDALIAQAEEANFDIAAAVARVRQADAQARIAGAPLLPTVSASASGQRERQPVLRTSGTGGSAQPRIENTFAATLSASYEIDFWGKNRAAADSAAAASAASRADRETVALTALTSVATTYFQILGLRERIRAAREGLGTAEAVLSAIQDRMAAGTATSLDLAQQESVVAAQRATIAPLDQQWRQDVNALAILVGRLPEEISLQPETLDRIRIPAVAPGLPSELLARRPDVRTAEERLRAANADIAVARAAFFPSLQLTAQGGFQSLALQSLLQHQHLLLSAASSVTQQIFSGGNLEGQLDLQRARYDELVETYRKTVASAFSDVENALIAVTKTAEEQEAQRQSEATARTAYDIAESQFRAGIADITTVLNVQRTLFSAQDAFAQAKLAHLQAVVSLYKAMGGGWSEIGG